MTKLPPILPGAGSLLQRYDVLFCDIWGVVHDGVSAYERAGDALARFRQEGGTVVLLSNAPMPWKAVAALLDEKAVRREAWDAIVTSGDITLEYVAKRGWKRIYKVEYDFDTSMFDSMPVEGVGVAEAEAIVCAGMRDHLHETPEAYRPELEIAVSRGLEFVCANPDLVVDVGGKLIQCAGTLAKMYEAMGGKVHWAGKPYGPAYEATHRAAEKIRGKAFDRSGILAIGDSVRTDMAGAAGYGIDALLVASGIHRDEILANGEIDPTALAKLLPAQQPHPIAAVATLGW